MVHIFIINAHAGSRKFSAGLRRYLETRGDLNYYIFHTRHREDEITIVRDVLNLFDGEELRIYSCGGSGTFRNILAGIEDPSKVELAFYAKGLTNDFLKTMVSDSAPFEDIDRLIDGRVIKVDYIKTNHGAALNTFSLGLDSVQVAKTDEYRAMSVFGRHMPYFLGFVAAVLKLLPYELEIEFDGQKKSGRFSEIFFGNGSVIGGALWFEEKSDVTDGLGRLVLFKNMRFLEVIKWIIRISQKKVSKLNDCGFAGYTSAITIRRCDGVPFVVDLDGELQKPQREWQAEIVKQGLNLVVPKEVAEAYSPDMKSDY